MTKEELQLRWDEILIQARFFCMDTSILALSIHFKNTYGDYPDKMGLLRTPREVANGYHVDMSALRFMCGYLPKIADYCWKHTSKDWSKVLDVVNRSTHDTRKVVVDVIQKTVIGMSFDQRKKLSRTARSSAVNSRRSVSPTIAITNGRCVNDH